MLIAAKANAKSASIHAVVTRANGKVENLGMISYWNKNPVLNWAGNSYIKVKEFINGRSRPKQRTGKDNLSTDSRIMVAPVGDGLSGSSHS